MNHEASPTASFGQALGTFFRRYVDFDGRASRREFWWVQLYLLALGVVLSLLAVAVGTSGDVGSITAVAVVAGAIGVAHLLPSLSLGARRMRDAGLPAWLTVIQLTGVGAIVLLVLATFRSVGDATGRATRSGPLTLELRGITKRFGSLVANDSIDLVVEPGQIHALLGENGAGKSTLMNVLFGLYQPDEGEILLDGEPQHFTGPGQAMAAGIGMVHQHFMLIPVFTVAENVMLGHEPTRVGGVLDLAGARAMVREISDRFGFDLDPDALVEDLPVGVQQRVEIVKALSRDARVLVLDEPTAVLTPQETDELMATMRKLADGGTSIVFITHKLREVKAVADVITVIRLGRVVGSADPSASTDELASLMVGRAVELTVAKEAPRLGEEALVVEDLTFFSPTGQRLLDEVSFSIRGGEVLAIAGVQGNGQTELAEVLVGLHPRVKGSIRLGGTEIAGHTVRQILDAGVGFVPEDRKVDGLVAEFTVAENLMLDRSFRGPFVRGLGVDVRHRDEFAADAIREFDIRTPDAETLVGRLSGGNQQKVVLARELGRELKLFVASQPTRGVDVGSIEFIHERIVEVRDSGVPVLIISTELDEVIALADRIAVMYRGAIVDIVPADTPREKLGQLMAGVHA